MRALILLLVPLITSSTHSTTKLDATSYNVTIKGQWDNQPDQKLFEENFAAWGAHINGLSSLSFEINLTDNTPTGRFRGRAGGTVQITQNGVTLLESEATHKLRTGTSAVPVEADVIVDVDLGWMRANYWMDPHPFRRTDPVPVGKVDLVTVFTHELVHAFGMVGWFDRISGKLPAGQTMTVYDSFIRFRSPNDPVFTGPAVQAVYGTELPLTDFQLGPALGVQKPIQVQVGQSTFTPVVSNTQNLYHYGRYTKPAEDPSSLLGLMGGAWLKPATEGLRILIGPLDVALLADLPVQ